MSRLRIGVSGWRYPHWRGGAFYPAGVPQRAELAYLSRRFPTVEINGSFYSLLRPATYEGYREQVPGSFRFAVKGPQFITHAKKLHEIETPLANFLASGVLCLEGNLGPILWQLPALRLDVSRIVRFLGLLPHDSLSAARLARGHDKRLNGRSATVVHRNRRVRHALEVRHPESLNDDVVRACRRWNVALAFSHSGGDWPYVEEVTTGWCYLRLHGAPRTYASGYSDRSLHAWARRIRAWSRAAEPDDAVRVTDRAPPLLKGRDVYAYFDNDAAARAPRDAARLTRILARER